MMHNFLANNRDELIARCEAKVALRPRRAASEEQLKYGVPIFLDQLTRTLQAESGDGREDSLKISGGAGGDSLELSEIGTSASAHGEELLKLGFTVDQVVHDYGDLCQSITDLAYERDAPFSIDEFRTLNRCLDNAIADAVTEFSSARDSVVARRQSLEANERMGVLAHELRNALGTAKLSIRALEAGGLSVMGATGEVLKRSLAALGDLIDQALAEVRSNVRGAPRHRIFSLSSFVAEAKAAAALHASARGCVLNVAAVDPLLGVYADRDILLSAVANLLDNAFKFSPRGTEVAFNAYAMQERILIDVSDRCGGLPPGSVERMFEPFAQQNSDRTGLGLGLSIARQGVEAEGGSLSVRDVPGTGCVFTISLPRYHLH